MTTFVLVPGGWRGAWTFDAVIERLKAAGHVAHALTLTGLRPDDDDATVALANLDTYAADVDLLDAHRPSDVTLVGHSYGGMVITVAADRAGGGCPASYTSTLTCRATGSRVFRRRTTCSVEYSPERRRGSASRCSIRAPTPIPVPARIRWPRSCRQPG